MIHTRLASVIVAAVILVLHAAPTAQGAIDQSDFLAPEEAFQYEVVPRGDQLLVKWDIAPDYYLYRKRMTITGQAAEPAAVAAGSIGARPSVDASARTASSRSLAVSASG